MDRATFTIPASEQVFKRVRAVYLFEDSVGVVHIRTQTISMLVPILQKDLEEAFAITEVKRSIAADEDSSEEYICVVGITLL